MILYRFLILGFLLLFISHIHVKAQHQELQEKPGIWKSASENTPDSNTLLNAFRRGNFNGHFRYFFMATDNESGLTDYFANAGGGGIRYETARFKGFQFGVSGFYIFNLGSSDLTKKDSASNQLNRYELGLFDVEDPGNKDDINRLEEFYLKYHYRKSYFQFGKFLLNSPLINLQDGRMRPSVVEGLWMELNPGKKIKIESGFLYNFSPRSTTKWYAGANSIGVYPSGIQPGGTPGNYYNNLQSAGTTVVGISYKVNTSFKITFWNYTIDNILNSALLQSDFAFYKRKSSTFSAGFQIIRQDAVHNGGNDDPLKSYVQKGASSMVYSGRLVFKNVRLETSLNYTRITDDGRYIFPREWGRDPFYTFMPRERNEGFGDVHALVAKINLFSKSKRISSGLALGYFQLPDVKNYALNKYGMPSYFQLNADLKYVFSGMLQGFELYALFVSKFKNGRSYDNPRYIINKVEMNLYNFVLNYKF
jgi:hypothetical protein